jgi:rod shape-determining protein MreD
MIDIAKLSTSKKTSLSALVNVLTVLGCALLLPTRWPGMELLHIGPNWLMMWVVAWSVKRSMWQGALAGLSLGLIQDGMSAGMSPSHTVSLVAVGVMTALLRKQRYIQEELASIAIITFFMSIASETVTAIQYAVQTSDLALFASNNYPIWLRYQQVAIASAILSSLWMPIVYYPLNWWWEKTGAWEKPS